MLPDPWAPYDFSILCLGGGEAHALGSASHHIPRNEWAWSTAIQDLRKLCISKKFKRMYFLESAVLYAMHPEF